MKSLTQVFCLISLAILLSVAGLGDAQAKGKKSKRPAVNRYADIVIEADTGYILRSENRNAIRHPASLTKMMTLYLVFQALENRQIELDTQFSVSALAACQPATKIGMRAGQKLRVYDAIMSLVTESANDAAVVLAEGVGGNVSSFVALMNKQAKALGMRNTVFKNPSGLPDKRQVTTARDMAVLAQALIHHYPGFYPYFSQRKYSLSGREMRNHNKLQEHYEGMDGIKTGYTNASGFNLAASAKRDGVRLIGIVFGGKTANSRNKQMKKLLDNAFMEAQRAPIRQILARGAPRRDNANFVSLPSKTDVMAPAKTGHQRLVLASPQAAPKPSLQTKEWGLQIGAFSEIAGAENALEQTSRISGPLLAEAEQSLQKVTMTDGSVVFRARFLGVDQKTARAVCTHLIKSGQSCLVVSGI